MTQRKIALIGYGAIAEAVCSRLAAHHGISINQILVKPDKLPSLKMGLAKKHALITRLDDVEPDTELVLECAGHAAVRQYGVACLSMGIDFGLVSVGALADEETCDGLRRTAQENDRQLLIVPGAIGGIDALAAAADDLTDVCYTACKPPMSWSGSPAEQSHQLEQIKRREILFEGSAREAALAFPKNANVVATVALAGIGFDATRVTLQADPEALGNSHHIRATGAVCDLDYKTEGRALPANPKTSALTALSVIRSLRHRGSGLVI